MRVVVTGANGHIGSNIVRAVAERGWTAVAFVRPGSDRGALDGVQHEIAEGDILEADSLTRAFDGADAVIHAAAVHRNFVPDRAEMLAPALTGTTNVLRAAKDCGVRRVVYTSTGATIGFAESADQPLTEETTLAHAEAMYIDAKIQAERAALAFEDGPEVVVVNPSGVLGPHDHRLTPATRGLVSLLQGDPAFLTLSITDVRDVAEGHLLALDKGTPGERYLLTGDVLPPKEIAAALERVAGIKPATFRPPGFVLNVIAWLEERKARGGTVDAAVTRNQLADVGHRHLAYDSSKAQRELGVTFRPADSVLRDAIAWLVQRDALKPKVASKVRQRLAAG
ncbi:MAG: NAD-dependent epimerase/dehydratase family protein [Myxococcales bacterium]|nr:NAD-dependent epimerase/dehydratase family protein [Myxococcales bacterium]